MRDARAVKDALRVRVEELAMYLFPNGKREGAHWCIGDISGASGESFKICISGDKAGLWVTLRSRANIPGTFSIYGCKREMSISRRHCKKPLNGLDNP